MTKPTYAFAADHAAMRCTVCGTTHHFHPCPNCLGERCEGHWRGGNTPKPIDEAKLRAMWVDPSVTTADMALALNCSQSSVSRNARRLSLGRRTYAPFASTGDTEDLTCECACEHGDIWGKRDMQPVDMASEMERLIIFNRSFDEATEAAPARPLPGDEGDGANVVAIICLAAGLAVVGLASVLVLL